MTPLLPGYLALGLGAPPGSLSAPPTVTTMTTSPGHASRTSFYRPELDALRFCAFFMVFLHHALPHDAAAYQPWCGAALAGALASLAQAFAFGLCLFFFLSAYLITSLLLIEINRTGKLHLRDFYLRRVLRIWPLYLVGLLLMLFFFLARHESPEPVLYYVFALGNWYYLNHPWGDNPMTQLWSISVEEQFYLFLPAVILLLRGRAQLLAMAAMIALLSLGCLYEQGAHHRNIDVAIWINTGSQAIFFAAGIASAILTAGRSFSLANGVRVGLALASGACFFAAAHFFEAKRLADATSGSSVCTGYLLVTAGCTGLLFVLLNSGWAFPRWLLYLGKISYGLYVFHVLSIEMVEKSCAVMQHAVSWFRVPGLLIGLVSLVLTIGIAAMSYHFLERPFLRLRLKYTFVPNRPV